MKTSNIADSPLVPGFFDVTYKVSEAVLEV